MRHFVIKAVANSAAKIGQTDAILHSESNLEKWRQACLTKNAVLGRLPLGRATAAANFRNDAKNRLRRRRLKEKA